MYIAAAGDSLIVKRMPGTAAAHDHRCRSWLPPSELSGYGAVADRSIVDNPADGTTTLRLGFSLSKSGNRAAPEPSGSPASAPARGCVDRFDPTRDYFPDKTALFRAVIANNRAGGWRKLVR